MKRNRPARHILIALVAVSLLLLSGCMYRPEERASAPAAALDGLVVVQHAVDRYRQETGVLPIKNSTEQTPIYEKYVIDFVRLLDRGDIGSVPANAFERGGSYYYVIVDPETTPTVKLMDLNLVQQVGDVQKRASDYVRRQGELPAGAEAAPGVHYVDFGKLGGDRVQIKSPYSNAYLPLLVDDAGTVAIDYGLEIARAVEKQGSAPADGEDARAWLVRQSPYVPVKSFPYRWKDDEPLVDATPQAP